MREGKRDEGTMVHSEKVRDERCLIDKHTNILSEVQIDKKK